MTDALDKAKLAKLIEIEGYDLGWRGIMIRFEPPGRSHVQGRFSSVRMMSPSFGSPTALAAFVRDIHCTSR